MIQRLLLVDDDAALSSVLVSALTEEGYQVTTAANGLEGLKAFKAHPPDLVVLDVLMPEMDGLEVCRRIRAQSQVPIIFLTSRAEEVDRVTGLESGADDYLTKPFGLRELCARIRAIARRLGPRPEPGEGAAAPAPAAFSGSYFIPAPWNCSGMTCISGSLIDHCGIVPSLPGPRGL